MIGPSHGQTSIERAGGDFGCAESVIRYQKTEVAVDEPANENTRRPAEIYTRNTGHAVVDNLI